MISTVIALVAFDTIVVGALAWAWITRGLPAISHYEAEKRAQTEALRKRTEELTR